MAGLSGIINVRKPAGMTSHDVVARLRRILRTKKTGHTGTLDPDAEGVLPVCVGRATKVADMLTASDKEYIAGVVLGFETDTQDISGSVTERRDMRDFNISAAELSGVLAGFWGASEQIPPMYSAIKVGGKKLYELAREGIEVERKPRPINISRIELLEFSPDDGNITNFKIKVSCSKGTYIRTLCSDIGKRLKCFGCMSSLVRTRSGRFSIKHSYTLSEIEDMYMRGDMSFLVPVDKVFSEFKRLEVDDKTAFRICNGITVNSPAAAAEGEIFRVYNKEGKFLTISEYRGEALKTLKTFYQE
ncbi:MAG TPA: tRNA pseudouridine(55) synthase TruB [Candidatus Monoglobus merdigallinarum]|uniref:tRNA pseudouridine synthase B n=1 Tax=Candidatus Monoglobus merdigallinarum TaxID=2838698 RepID=A0A9D1PRA2_9FIRM|nr:tRNA pseudouridine(55) synthase TruB [Candidatus Monoglobus merdigallinarum]